MVSANIMLAPCCAIVAHWATCLTFKSSLWLTLKRDRRRKRGCNSMFYWFMVWYINAPYLQLHIYPRGCDRVILLGFDGPYKSHFKVVLVIIPTLWRFSKLELPFDSFSKIAEYIYHLHSEFFHTTPPPPKKQHTKTNNNKKQTKNFWTTFTQKKTDQTYLTY